MIFGIDFNVFHARVAPLATVLVVGRLFMVAVHV